eukprot:gnl/TRDRNA2_/TRDRNA2_170036_c0_seq11.p1 gnl/TRDRNA2_/TRDRNA2_170036_c0~~gnl/TRDRNA2_/TRDRNA2_170036_c0_seq11.p1  ORF type:complete len:376 (-),score=74.05 gnl/TRDRNA2_/TRDRNA2_170036_c0_seq11:237-1364(-)
MSSDSRLRLGILGTARHVPVSVVAPLQKDADLGARVVAAAVAARDLAEAEAFAKQNGIPKAYGTFEELLADPQVDAVYNALPISMRCAWTVKSLVAGKHVLCESPLGLHPREVVVVQRAAEDSGRVCLESTHPTSHPALKKVRELLNEGKVGVLERIEINLPTNYAAHGEPICSKNGALMALGCYCVGTVRALASEEPRVKAATARASPEDPTIDLAMRVELALPSGAEAHFECSIAPEEKERGTTPGEVKVTVSGSNGVMRIKEWFSGRGVRANEVLLETFDDSGDRYTEPVSNPGAHEAYYYQLKSFADEVREQERHPGAGMPWNYHFSSATASDAVKNMAVIDAIYQHVGMPTRRTKVAPPTPYDRIGASKL